MEARLTDIPTDPRMQIAPGTLDALSSDALAGGAAFAPSETAGNATAPAKDQPHSAVTLRIDRYLQAAGAMDKARRSRVTAAAARDLLARGASAEPGWAEVIAAVDRSLAIEFATADAAAQTSARGRVALILAEQAAASGAAARMDRDWGTPTRHRLAMPAQDLTAWRPDMQRSADRLSRLRVSPVAQGVAACLSWLAVLFIP